MTWQGLIELQTAAGHVGFILPGDQQVKGPVPLVEVTDSDQQPRGQAAFTKAVGGTSEMHMGAFYGSPTPKTESRHGQQLWTGKGHDSGVFRHFRVMSCTARWLPTPD